jgi:hypothetical protein
MSFNPFGGIFDFNRDGSTDSFEMATGLFMLNELDKSMRQQEPDCSFSGGFGDTDDDEEDGDGVEIDLAEPAPVDPFDLSLGDLDAFTRPSPDPLFDLGSGFDF